MQDNKSYADVAHMQLASAQAPRIDAEVRAMSDSRPPAEQKFLYNVKTALHLRYVVKMNAIFELLESLGACEIAGNSIDFTNPTRNAGKGSRGYAREAVEAIVRTARDVQNANIQYVGDETSMDSVINEIAESLMAGYGELAAKCLEPQADAGFSLEFRDLVKGGYRSLISGAYLKTVNITAQLDMYAPVMLKPKALANMCKFAKNIQAQGVDTSVSLVFDPSNFNVSPEIRSLFVEALEMPGYTVTVESGEKEIVLNFTPIEKEE